MNMHYKTEKVLSGLPPEIGEYLHLFIYFEASECLTVAAVTAAGTIAASEIPYAGALVSSILTAYVADIVTKNQGSGVDVEIRIPIVAATGLASYVHISTHRPADATSSYEGYFTSMRATVSGDALGPGTTPDGWERLGWISIWEPEGSISISRFYPLLSLNPSLPKSCIVSSTGTICYLLSRSKPIGPFWVHGSLAA